MKDTMTRKNRIRTRIIATALAAISVFSAGSVAMSSVSAATVSSVKVQSAASDGFFSGASALIGLIGKSNPLVGIGVCVFGAVIIFIICRRKRRNY